MQQVIRLISLCESNDRMRNENLRFTAFQTEFPSDTIINRQPAQRGSFLQRSSVGGASRRSGHCVTFACFHRLLTLGSEKIRQKNGGDEFRAIKSLLSFVDSSFSSSPISNCDPT